MELAEIPISPADSRPENQTARKPDSVGPTLGLDNELSDALGAFRTHSTCYWRRFFSDIFQARLCFAAPCRSHFVVGGFTASPSLLRCIESNKDSNQPTNLPTYLKPAKST